MLEIYLLERYFTQTDIFGVSVFSRDGETDAPDARSLYKTYFFVNQFFRIVPVRVVALVFIGFF
jgi:hypothetical protein